jgi:hypothetical protein
MIDVPNTLLEKGYEGLSEEEAAVVIEYAMAEIRARRNKLLKVTDVYALPDYPFSSEDDRQSLLDYRQALRDITTDISPTYNPITLELQGVDFPTHSLVTQEMYNTTGAVHIKNA